MSPGDVFLAYFPFGGSQGTKLRPVLVLSGPVGPIPEVLVAYMSSVIPPALLPSDLILDPASPEHVSTNLKAVSVVRLHKLATLHQRSLVRRLGTVSVVVMLEVANRLRTFLNLRRKASPS